MVKIFISYRRADSNEESRFIYDALASRFGEENIFRDKDRIPKGSDFRKTIEQYVFASDEMLVLIGEKWLDIREHDEPSKRRLDNPEDFVRIEIAMGLRHVENITPVVLQNARMPGENELPRRLTQLGWQNAYFLRPDYINEDLQTLVDDIASRHNEVIDNSISGDGLASQRSPVRWIVSFAIIAFILLTLIGWMSGLFRANNGSEAPEPSATREIEEIEDNTQVASNEISAAEARETGAAEAWAVLTSLAPTTTPTITSTPTATPISSGDIQLTGRAEIFGTATSLAQIEATILPLTQNAVLTEQFIIDATATDIAKLSLTPTETETRPPTATLRPTNTPIPRPTSTEIISDSGNGTVTVNVESANLRSGPGTNYSRDGSASSGTVLDIIARTSDSDWYLIEKLNGDPAWIWSGIVDITASNANIEVAATIPATPEGTINTLSNTISNTEILSTFSIAFETAANGTDDVPIVRIRTHDGDEFVYRLDKPGDLQPFGYDRYDIGVPLLECDLYRVEIEKPGEDSWNTAYEYLYWNNEIIFSAHGNFYDGAWIDSSYGFGTC